MKHKVCKHLPDKVHDPNSHNKATYKTKQGGQTLESDVRALIVLTDTNTAMKFASTQQAYPTKHSSALLRADQKAAVL